MNELKTGDKILYNPWGKRDSFEVWTIVEGNICRAASKEIGLVALHEKNEPKSKTTHLQKGLRFGYIRIPPSSADIQPGGFKSTEDLYMNLQFNALQSVVESLYDTWLSDDRNQALILGEAMKLERIIQKWFSSGYFKVERKLSQMTLVNQ